MSDPPPYTVDPPSEASIPSPLLTTDRVAGDVRTCSIADLQHDYIRISRDTSTSYHVNLTVDPTPRYRIHLSTDSSDVGDILIFPAFSSTTVPVAALRRVKDPKRTDPLAWICTRMPQAANARWLPVTKAASLVYGEVYRSQVPIVTTPGLPKAVRSFVWRAPLLTPSAPYMEIWWEGPLPYMSQRQSSHDDFRYIFATCMLKGVGGSKENVIQIRRGGGLEFELTVILGMFAVLHHMKKTLM